MKRAVLIPVTTIFASRSGMGNAFLSREELQAIFARASVRRTERRAFVEIMRRIAAFRASLERMSTLTAPPRYSSSGSIPPPLRQPTIRKIASLHNLHARSLSHRQETELLRHSEIIPAR